MILLLFSACNSDCNRPCKTYKTKYEVGLIGKTVAVRPVSVCVER